MIEMLDQSSGKVFGMRVSGKLAHQDYERFVPLLGKLIEDHGSVRCLVDLTDLQGIEPRALWGESLRVDQGGALTAKPRFAAFVGGDPPCPQATDRRPSGSSPGLGDRWRAVVLPATLAPRPGRTG